MRQTLLCVLVLGALAKAMPYPHIVNLAEAINRTVCPIVEETKLVLGRIPRRIKELKCAPNPEELCKQHIPQHECCTITHGTHCVEMYEKILVQYLDGTNDTLRVAVGCSCMVADVGIASTVLKEAN